MLTSRHLPALAAQGIAIPGYARNGTAGVVHLGLGAFHRAHQALVFDALLRRGDARWGVLGVAMRNTALADALAAQDGLYSVQIASATGISWHLSGSVWGTCVAAREPLRVAQAIGAPSTRWITLTVTEKAYQPALAELLLQGLALRHAAALPGLTIASCDNLAHNGLQLRALVLQAAQSRTAALSRWVATQCAFPSSMVDRIVPAASAPCLAAARQALGVADHAALCTEEFWEWVIERRFVDARDADALRAVGVKVVDDVAPFEEAKLRMLNASHSAMACIGAVAGLPLVSACIAMPAIHQFVYELMTVDVGPHLTRPDWATYRDALLVRFASPAPQHGVHQIATDSSQKIPQRWTPVVLDALDKRRPVERFAFAAAAWMRYLRGSDERGRSYDLRDPMAEQLQALALANAGNHAATVQALGTLGAIWGQHLPLQAGWLERIGYWLQRIDRVGMLAALDILNTWATRVHRPPPPSATTNP